MTTATLDIKEALLSNLTHTLPNSLPTADNSIPAIRKEALDALNQLEFPTSRNEEWKYTDFTKPLLKKFDFSKKIDSISLTIKDIEGFKIKGLDALYLIFINGFFFKELSNELAESSSTLITKLADADTQNIQAFRDHYSRHIDFQKDFFSALSTAFSSEGLFVKVQENSVVEKPIVFLFISDSTAGNSLAQPRNLIHLGRSSAATIIEKFVSVGSNPQLTNTISEIIVSENASLDHYKLQNEGAESYHVDTTQVYQEQGSNLSTTTITTHGGMVRNNLNIKLDGENCKAYMNGLYLINGNSHVDNHTTVDHAKPNSYSNELYKGIMDDKASGVFNGKIFVRQDAQKTNAFQSNRNVLLSPDATIYTKPQLEIWADDVKCSHGATTGQIDEEALFYLQSRGISKDKAKSLMMLAFASEVVQLIKVNEIKEYVEAIIEEMLRQE